MTGLNKYCKRSHISEAKFRQIIKLFCHDLPASKVAQMTDVSVSKHRLYQVKLKSMKVILAHSVYVVNVVVVQVAKPSSLAF